MHLFALQTFSDRFGVDLTVADFNDAVREASRAATQDLASRFRLGPLSVYETRRDFFFVDRMSRQGTADSARFFLSRAFVTAATVLAVYSPSPVNVRNGDDDSYTDISRVANDNRSNYGALDAERGVYSVYGLNLSHQWVAVTYSGGLDTNSDSEYENVPDWLQEAALNQTALNLSRHVMFNPEEGNSDLSELRDTIARLWRDNARLALSPADYRPRFTDIV